MAAEVPDDDAWRRSLWHGWWSARPPPAYWLTRSAFLRALGLVYLVAFLVTAWQLEPLIGERGILPVSWLLEDVGAAHETWLQAVWDLPTIFWIDDSDGFMQSAAWLGVALSAGVVAGLANVPIVAALWGLYLSFVHVGQIFYGYGWELMMCETGFLAIFLAPTWDPRPLSGRAPPSRPVLVLLRWLLFRVMFGAGLIKIRGDACWSDLTCLFHHFETQPIPSPASWYFHHLPGWALRGGVALNHVAELVAPWGVLVPWRPVRHGAGLVMAAFQVMLIVSGNLSFLNWLTLVLAIACFDDGALRRLAPRALRKRAASRAAHDPEPSRARRAVTWTLVGVIGVLSVNPVVNMLSSRQLMNASFDPFHLVNTYGAFGSVSETRREVVLEGTHDPTPGPDTEWKAYEFPCKPGDPTRRPCLVTPYHYRLDWQMWFAALGDYRSQPWIVRLVHALLKGNETVPRLLAHDPFPERPPRHIRASLYRYELTGPDSAGDAWWTRERVGTYLQPLSLGDPGLRRFLRRHGWLRHR